MYLYEILTSGYLDESFSDESDVADGMNSGIYCLYMWDGIPQIYKDMDWIYGGTHRYVIVMDTDIAKTNEMYVCKSVSYETCIDHSQTQIIHSTGNKKVNFEPLRKHIMKQINEEINRTIRNRDTMVYTESHEVVLKGKIPISNIKAILVSKRKIDSKSTKKIIKFIEDHHLPIKIIPFAPYTQNFQKYFQMI